MAIGLTLALTVIVAVDDGNRWLGAIAYGISIAIDVYVVAVRYPPPSRARRAYARSGQ